MLFWRRKLNSILDKPVGEFLYRDDKPLGDSRVGTDVVFGDSMSLIQIIHVTKATSRSISYYLNYALSS